MVLATVLCMECDHIDVNTAFLYADLLKPMFMQGPPGYPCQDGYCLKVVKALYGCRTAPREWYKTLSTFIISMGFKKTLLDPCLFVRGCDESLFIIFIYVDDILLCTAEPDEMDRTKIEFFRRFKCKNLGEVKRFLGVWVERADDSSTSKLHQGPYCKEIVDKYAGWYNDSPTESNEPKKMPLPVDFHERVGTNFDLPQPEDEAYEWWINFPYLQMIGAALYLAINTRPDIMFAVCMLARYSKDRTIPACTGLCYLFSYLSGTCDLGISYVVKDGDDRDYETLLDLHGLTDSDWASDVRTRRSTAGYLVMALGGPLAWGSKLMTTVAASSMEAEYMGAYFLGQMLLYIRELLKELGLELIKPTLFFMDAMSAIQALKNRVYHARTKHVAVKWRWLVQYIGTIFDICHLRSGDMTADLLTKAAMRKVWLELIQALMGTKPRY